ncbi:MFS transporter [Salipaludibacillus neizhouensis]|uniref:MFS transporter n=1 Tax=Salipaludibacillus neizhouensis TaxID=885475 RepID=A0A3A9KRL4_9BACI|nr:MFS transporter [Salipaludibacillus neizhouensis]RKL67316.1 MFS transporter [Salipaludibacillus neizhouensis]
MGEPAIKSRDNEVPEFKKNYSVFRFIGGNLISFCGDQIYLIAFPLMVLAITGSPLIMGIVAALERLPVLFQPVTGILADRYNRKHLLLFCDFARCIIVGLIGVLFILDALEIWVLYSGAFIVGTLSQIYNTSQFASIPKLVRNSDLQVVNSINTGFFNTAVLVAPGIGGFIISLYNPGYALLINSFSFFIAFLAILSINLHTEINVEKKKRSFWIDIKEGFHFVIQTKPILFTNLAMLASVFGTTLFLTMLVFHLTDTMHLSAEQTGLLLSIGGIGAIGGALATNFLRKKYSYRRILFGASFIGGLSIVFFGLANTYFLLIISNAIGTLAASMMNPCIVTIRQTLTPDQLLGRVQATSRFMTWILMPVAALLAGVLSNQFGTNFTIVLGGIISTAASFFYLHRSLKY